MLRYALILFFVLCGAWLLLSGHWTAPLLSLGIASVLLVVLCAKRLGILDSEGLPLRLLPGLARYAPWLAGQIVSASVDVARRIVDPRLPISPSIIHVEADQRSAVGRVSYANSITLTPGTISLDVADNQIEVHALTEQAAEQLTRGEMARRVCAMEDGSC